MSTARGTALVFLSYVLVAAAFTWPTASFALNSFPTRHFDLMPSVWLIHAAPETFPELVYEKSLWPHGELLARLDSYVLLAVSWINHGLLDGLLLSKLFILLGPALSALAAERCAARGFDVPRPWSWIAGIVYGFSGVLASAVLEGQVYSLLNPWLPLLLWASRRGCGPRGRFVHGLAGGACWALAHLTSAYFGALGILILAIEAFRGVFAERSLKRVVVYAAGVALLAIPAGLFQLWLFSFGGLKTEPTIGDLVAGSITLGELLAWTDAADVGYHSVSAPLHWTAFWLMMMAPIILRNRSGWRVMMTVAVACILLSFGPLLRVTRHSPAMASPLRGWMAIPGATFFRFPYRLMWLCSLCTGVVAAQAAAAVAQSGVRKRWVAIAFPMSLIDTLVVVGLPARMRDAIAEVPDVYDAIPPGVAVLDAYSGKIDIAIARESESAGDAFLWQRSLTCYYQAYHGHPTPAQCIGTFLEDPRSALQDDVLGLAFAAADHSSEDAAERIPKLLRDAEVGALALHLEFLRPMDREVALEGLTLALGPPAAESVNGGEHIALFLVPADPGANRGDAVLKQETTPPAAARE